MVRAVARTETVSLTFTETANQTNGGILCSIRLENSAGVSSKSYSDLLKHSYSDLHRLARSWDARGFIYTGDL